MQQITINVADILDSDLTLAEKGALISMQCLTARLEREPSKEEVMQLKGVTSSMLCRLEQKISNVIDAIKLAAKNILELVKKMRLRKTSFRLRKQKSRSKKREYDNMSRVTCNIDSYQYDNSSVAKTSFFGKNKNLASKTKQKNKMSRVTSSEIEENVKRNVNFEPHYNNDLMSINTHINNYSSSSKELKDDDDNFFKRVFSKKLLVDACRAIGISTQEFHSTLDRKIGIDVERQRRWGSPIRSKAALRRHLIEKFLENSEEYEYWVDQIKEADLNASRCPDFVFEQKDSEIKQSLCESESLNFFNSLSDQIKNNIFIKIKDKIKSETKSPFIFDGLVRSKINEMSVEELYAMS